ncbi:MAG: ABC transporter substrate-binding protein [Methanomassiliicoccales archaeon]
MKRSTQIAIVVIVIIIIIAGSIGYIQFTAKKPAKTVQTLTIEAQSQPDSLDPGVTSATAGWGVVQQIYQTLVTYNNSSVTNVVGQLAYKWTHGPNFMNWTFYLRQNVTFSNGDPFNAYVMWYSLYRSMLMNQSESFILEQNLNASNGPSSNFLNTTNFSSPTSSELAVMENTSLSVYVVSKYVLHITVGGGYLGPYPYAYFLQTLTAPIAAAVDPIYIDQHGGIIPNQPNSWMFDHAMGTGPYVLQSWVQGDYVKLSINPNYWADKLPPSAIYNAIAPAKDNVLLQFVSQPSTAVEALKSGQAQAIGFSFSPDIVNELKGMSNVVVSQTPIIYGSTQGAWYIYFNLTAPYFNLTDVRAAVVHAIDYQLIIQDAFGGYASQWVGPVPAGFPDYNPSNLTPYYYNVTLAKQEMAAAGYPHGLPGTFNFLYINSEDFVSAAQIIQSDLKAIGINITLVGVTSDRWYSITDYPGGNASGYPIGIDFYTADYVSPDDYTQEIAALGGSPSQVTTFGNDNNLTNANLSAMNNLVFEAAAQTNATLRSQEYAQMTEIAYNNYYFDWLVIPYVFSIYSTNLKGFVINPMGSAYPNFVMFYNTEYYT